MSEITKNPVDWATIERGVPITNDSFFVRHDSDTGLIYDDRGGYIHQNNCFVETRREITWIQHNQSSTCPCATSDIVLVETLNGKLSLKRAYMVFWGNVRCFRVVRQKIIHDQPTASSAEIKKVNDDLKPNRKIFAALGIVAAAIFI